MIDYSTRMPVDMNTMAQAHEGNMVDAPSPCERPRRIGTVNSESIIEHRVAYSDIDFNRHMNTMRYIDIIFDSLPIEVPEKLSAFRLDMNFMKESRYNDKLSLKSEQNEQTYLFAYVNEAGEALCRMALEVR
jgi:acyl-ACP thioesterase